MTDKTPPTAEQPVLAEWDNPIVQKIYDMLCADLSHKPDEEHWEGYLARWIVGELILPILTALQSLAGEMGSFDPQNSDPLAIIAELRDLNLLKRQGAKLDKEAAVKEKSYLLTASNHLLTVANAENGRLRETLEKMLSKGFHEGWATEARAALNPQQPEAKDGK